MGEKVCGGSGRSRNCSFWCFHSGSRSCLEEAHVEFLCIDDRHARGNKPPRHSASVCLSVQYKTCKDGSVLGVTVMRIAMLTHCQAITQSCSYTEGSTHIYSCWLNLWTALLSCYGRLFLSDAQMLKFDLLCFCFSAETIVNVLDFKKDVGLWHAIQTVRKLLYETTIPRR